MKLARMLLAAASIMLVGSTCVKAEVPGPKTPGAKGLFFEQEKNPTTKMNVGLQYWFELRRDGEDTERVGNKFAFQSGDRIKIHVKPNIDGYAYILLKSGSQGEHSVLFPDAKAKENNRVIHGQDVALPTDGWIAFDENPGVETVGILVSRSPVDANAYLKVPDKQRVLIACADTGSKDLVPVKILLAYASTTKEEEAPRDPAGNKGNATTATTTSPKPKNDKQTKIKTAEKVPEKHAKAESGVMTIVHTDPSSMLAVDVQLKHK